MIYNLLINNIVVNCIVADPDFITNIAHQYDLIVDVTENPSRPDIGWIRDPDFDTYSPPEIDPVLEATIQDQVDEIKQQIDVIQNQLNAVSQAMGISVVENVIE